MGCATSSCVDEPLQGPRASVCGAAESTLESPTSIALDANYLQRGATMTVQVGLDTQVSTATSCCVAPRAVRPQCRLQRGSQFADWVAVMVRLICCGA